MHIRLLIFGFLVAFANVTLLAQTITQETFDHDGLTRSYIIVVPDDIDEGSDIPLVINMHGFTSSANEQMIYSNMNPVAQANKFIVVYPEGIDAAWNVGWTFGSTADDVGFLSELIAFLITDQNIDPQRVYACGMSNGGFMSYRMACERPDLIAAVASVTGSIVPSFINECNPDSPVAVMEIHGTADLVVPYTGSPGIALPIEDVVDFWVERWSCNPSPQLTEIEDNDPFDNSTATRLDYNNCEDESEVSFIRVQNGGHTWPGSPINLPVTNYDFDASATIWEFFSRHQLDGLSAADDRIVQGRPYTLKYNLDAGQILIETTIAASYEWLDMNGQLIASQKSPISAYRINAYDYTSGIYLLQIHMDGRKYVEKVFIPGL